MRFRLSGHCQTAGSAKFMRLRRFPSWFKTKTKGFPGTSAVLAVLAGGAGVFLLTGREPADEIVDGPSVRASGFPSDGRPVHGGAPDPHPSNPGTPHSFFQPAGKFSLVQNEPQTASHERRISDGRIASLEAAHAPSSKNATFSHRRPAAETESVAIRPRFRPLQPESPPDDYADQAVGVVLDFADSQQLPAVLAASGLTAQGPSLQQAQEDRIAREFISAVTAPAADTDGTAGVTAPNSSYSSTEAVSDADWEAAARQADEEFRVLVGQDVYQQKALEAALLKRQADEVPH